MRITTRTARSAKGDITLYRLTNSLGAYVELSTLGAGITAVAVPDRDGTIAGVALGYADPADYLYDGPCMGKIPGRYANRIARGVFAIDGQEYRLAVNNGPNALHGGPEGFQNRLWQARELPDGIEFTYVSADGEEGYPGRLTVKATYRWDDSCRLSLELCAATSRPTVVNLTNHTYWNLRGADSGSVLGQEMQIKGSRYLPTDDTLIPSGAPAPVSGTPMDFREPKPLGRDIKDDFPALEYGKGYDACWVADSPAPGTFIPDVVVLSDPASGRRLTIGTDQPGVQVYTGNWLAGSPRSAGGREYADYDGVAVEAQGFPDAPNRPNFPSQRLEPGDLYCRHIVFAFTTY